MSRAVQGRHQQEVEGLVNKFANQNMQAYKALVSIIGKYKRKQSSQLETYREIASLFQVISSLRPILDEPEGFRSFLMVIL